jgi:dimethylargininase
MSLVPVPVSGVLHLKSAVLPVDPETVVVTPGTVDEGLLEGLRIVHETDNERHRFSALPLADGSLLVTANATETAGMLIDLGMRPVPIDVSEIQAADGGLTCMSILFEGWPRSISGGSSARRGGPVEMSHHGVAMATRGI